jgi:hypothetical protein
MVAEKPTEAKVEAKPKAEAKGDSRTAIPLTVKVRDRLKGMRIKRPTGNRMEDYSEELTRLMDEHENNRK